MMQDMEVQQVSDHSLNAMDAGVAEFHHFMTFSADDVVVLAVAVALLVLGKIAAELMLADEALLDQQVQGIVNSGTAYLQAALLHTRVELVDVEMAGTNVDFFENGVALTGFAEAFILEVSREKLANFVEFIGIQGCLGGRAGRVLGRVARFGRTARALAGRIGGGVGKGSGRKFTHCIYKV